MRDTRWIWRRRHQFVQVVRFSKVFRKCSWAFQQLPDLLHVFVSDCSSCISRAVASNKTLSTAGRALSTFVLTVFIQKDRGIELVCNHSSYTISARSLDHVRLCNLGHGHSTKKHRLK